MRSLISNRRIHLLPALLLIFVCFGTGLILFFFAASPASAYIFGPTPTATQENLWSYADVPKPTQTATSIVLPTDTAIPATATPGTMAMEILEDTPVPTRPAVQP